MTEFKLVYFNARGRCEPIRYIFAYADQVYEDFRIVQSDWHIYKPYTVFGQLPVLELTDENYITQIAQTLAICRFLGNRFHLTGKTDLENVKYFRI
jgi:glutathione S-transferase